MIGIMSFLVQRMYPRTTVPSLPVEKEGHCGVSDSGGDLCCFISSIDFVVVVLYYLIILSFVQGTKVCVWCVSSFPGYRVKTQRCTIGFGDSYSEQECLAGYRVIEVIHPEQNVNNEPLFTQARIFPHFPATRRESKR